MGDAILQWHPAGIKEERKEQEKKNPALDEGVARKYQAYKIKRQHWNQCWVKVASSPVPPPCPHTLLPALSKSLHNIHAVTDVSSLGLAITVFPAAMAGAIFQVSR